MSMDRVEKTRQQPRQGSSLRPHPIGRDRASLSRGRACRCYALTCGRGTLEIRETFGSAAPFKAYAKSALQEALCLGWCGNRRLRSANRIIEDS